MAHEYRRTFAVNDMIVFLVPFSNLRSLTLECIGFVREPEEQSALPFFPRLSYLKGLKLRKNKDILAFLDALHAAINQDLLPCLEHLEAGKLRPEDLHLLHSLFDRLSNQLRFLTLQFYHQQHSVVPRTCLLTNCSIVAHSPQTKASSSPRSDASRASPLSSRSHSTF